MEMISSKAPWIPEYNEYEATSSDSILNFLKEHPNRRYSTGEIVRGIGCLNYDQSYSKISNRLTSLAKFRIIERDTEYRGGRRYYYDSSQRKPTPSGVG